MALSSGPSPNQIKARDPLRDRLKAVNDQIADRENVGLAATPYLLQQKAELEARLGIVTPPVAVQSPSFERKDVEPPTERAVPRGPGRPRKHGDDGAAGL